MTRVRVFAGWALVVVILGAGLVTFLSGVELSRSFEVYYPLGK